MERVTSTTLQEMLRFLKTHENYTLFLLGNYENYGTDLKDAPYSGNFKLIRSNKEIVGVCCLTRKGNLLIEATLQEEIFDTVLETCQQELIPLKGLVGNWEFCGLFWEYLKVSMADLNAKALDLGQVGGVYTSPKFRQRGYSKAVMKQLLHDSKKFHSIRKLIIFTGENNFAAQKLYTSLGASQIGHFALLFGQ